MNKRGFIFTFISVTLVSVIMLAFLIQYTSRTKVEIEKTNTEVETMNSFVKSLNEDYLPRALKISGNQAILALLYCMDPDPDVECDGEIERRLREGEDEYDNYLGNNVNQRDIYIKNAIIHGKFSHDEGVRDNDPILELMTIEGINYNLSSVLNEIVNLANFTGINLEINSDITIRQFKQDMDINMNKDKTDPWHIYASMKISYRLFNKDETISWNYEEEPVTIETWIPISNFVEPVYMIKESLKVNIKNTSYELPGQIESHVADWRFVSCSESPNFLDRMIRNTQELPYKNGIESLYARARGNPDKSAIDYQYLWEEIEPAEELEQIEDSRYYIDGAHAYCYNI